MLGCKRPDKNSGSKCKTKSATKNCPLTGNPIVSVRVLDGGEKEAAGAVDQFVNLPEGKKWVTDGVSSIDRLTEKLRVKVRFKRPGTEKFKLRLVPHPKNAEYSKKEKGRNGKYDHAPKKDLKLTTAQNGTRVLEDLHSVAVAGGNRYQFEAEDKKGNKVLSRDVRVRRRIFLQEIKMQGAPCAASLGTLTGEYGKHEIELRQLPSVQMARIENVGADSGPFQKAVRTAYKKSQGPDKEPHCVAVAYTDHEAVKDANVQIEYRNKQVGPGKGPLPAAIVNAAGNSAYLWNNIVTGEDWFVSASFLENGADEANRISIPRTKCTPIQATGKPADACRTVSIDTADVTPTVKTGTVRLVVNTVNRMRAGLSFGGGNLICICTRAWWSASPEADQNQTMIHEMGHKIGMVPNGDDLDRLPNYYSGSGHVGPHCHAGVAKRTNYSNAPGSTCVMFGETNGQSAFCDDCAKAVKKIDISKGWKAF
jgi:hypothetical protein